MSHSLFFGEKSISVHDIQRFMTHESLDQFKRKGSNAPIKRVESYQQELKKNPYKNGVVFVSPSKEALTEGKGYIISSYETLREKYGHVSHWTPNTFRGGTYYDFKRRIIKGHSRDNLKQINVIAFDIDTKDVDLYALYLGCEALQLPKPNLLLETPRGYQCFFVLSTPFYISSQQDYKSLRIAERISDNVRKALSEYAPVDRNCVPFGFYRMPTEDNTLDFHGVPADTQELIRWSQQYERAEQKALFTLVPSSSDEPQPLYRSEWYQALIQASGIKRGFHGASRNNAIMTLALANYASERPLEEAYDELDQFNSFLDAPLSRAEFERTLKSAYSGKYKGVKRSYVEGLLELWTDGRTTFCGREGWYKFKKERQDRQRSHYTEWEEDIIAHLKTATSPDTPFMKGSLVNLADQFNMPVSSLKEVLKRSKQLIKHSVGRGRAAVTTLTSKTILLQSIIALRKKGTQPWIPEEIKRQVAASRETQLGFTVNPPISLPAEWANSS